MLNSDSDAAWPAIDNSRLSDSLHCHDLPPVKKIAIAVLIALGIGAGIWLARPFYSKWKQQRFLSQAQSAWAKHDFQNAIFNARKILEINPASADACRLMAQILEQAGSPQTLAY